MSTAPIIDFSKGYYDTDVEHSSMPVNALVRAENARWRKRDLDQRGGHQPYGTTTYASSDVIRGVSERVYLNSAWMNVEAIDLNANSEVRFFVRLTTGLAQISATVVFTTGYAVTFAELSGHIVAVNGVDKPLVIYYDSGWQIETLEAHDIRTWAITSWNAGQFDNSEYDSGTWFVDDTTHAQDSTADNFQLGNTTANDGFVISSANPFNKVVFTSAEQAGGAPVAEYKYWASNGTWKTLTPTTTPSWTAAAGDRTLEWDYISDLARFTGSDTGVANYFLVRVRFTTAASGAFSCDTVAVYHSQYLTEVMSGSIPHLVAAHNSRLWLATGYIVFWCPPNDVVGWRGLSESEYFLEGGAQVRAMLSFKGYLIVFKDNAIYHFYGQALDSFLRKKIADFGISQVGAYAKGGDEVYFLSDDGIRVLQGVNCYRVSTHIKDDLDGFTQTGAVATERKGEVYFSFPSDSVVLWFDPDGLTRDEESGEGHVGFSKFTSYLVNYFVDCKGNGDTGFFLAAVNTTQPYEARLENGSTDKDRAGTAAAIDYRVQSAYLAFRKFTTKKVYELLKTKVKRDASNPTTYTLTVYADDGDRSASASFTVAAGSRYHIQQSALPDKVDGYNLSLEVRNNGEQDAGLRGFEVEYEYEEF